VLLTCGEKVSNVSNVSIVYSLRWWMVLMLGCFLCARKVESKSLQVDISIIGVQLQRLPNSQRRHCMTQNLDPVVSELHMIYTILSLEEPTLYEFIEQTGEVANVVTIDQRMLNRLHYRSPTLLCSELGVDMVRARTTKLQDSFLFIRRIYHIASPIPCICINCRKSYHQ